MRSFFSWFYHSNADLSVHNTRRWLFALFEENQRKLCHTHPKKLIDESPFFAIFWANSPLSVNCFNCSFVLCVKWWTRLYLWLWINANAFVSLLVNAAPILRSAFSCSDFQSTGDVLHFLKCLPCLLAHALSVDGHLIAFCGFSSPFPVWKGCKYAKCLPKRRCESRNKSTKTLKASNKIRKRIMEESWLLLKATIET